MYCSKNFKKQKKLPTDSEKYLKYDQTCTQRNCPKQILKNSKKKKIEERNIKIKQINKGPKIIKYNLATTSKN